VGGAKEKVVIVKCPYCGKPVIFNGLGRPPLNISLKNVCESLLAHGSVAEAAQTLNCSQGYIFNALRANGLRLKNVINNHNTPTSGE